MSTSSDAWIETFTGRAFHPLAPQREDIYIGDIAHALSLICRFNGHVRQFYSVAEHSVRVSFAGELQFYGWRHMVAGILGLLLHDASEAYLCDVPSPIKHTPEMAGYRDAEKRLQSEIYERFGVICHGDDYYRESLHRLDMRMLFTERRDIMSSTRSVWTDEHLYPPFPDRIVPWSSDEAEHRFLLRFEDLRSQARRAS